MISNNSQISNSSGYRTLQSLNLIDSFLFQEFTEKEENAKLLAKLIVKRVTGIELGNNILVENEKVINGVKLGLRGIRMDIRVIEKNGEKVARIHNIEPNIYQDKDLAYRCRYYQSITDAKYLKSGCKFRELPTLVSIWILEQDLFGENRMMYTVKNMVEENSSIVYNDGVTKIFLYTKGKIGGSKELESLLKYMSDTNVNNAVDTELETVHTIVSAIKEDEGTGERYMTLQDMIDYEKELSYELGEASGMSKGISQGISQGKTLLITSAFKNDIPEEQIVNMLVDGYSMEKEEAAELVAKVKEQNNY